MLEEPACINPPTLIPRVALEGRHIDFIDQVAEERRLREDLGVEERRLRLEWDRQQLLESMEPARRVHIVERDGKDQAPKKRRDEAGKAASGCVGTPADDVVTFVDRLEEGPQVIRDIRLGSGGDQNQRQAGSVEAAAHRFGQAEIVDR